jgi:hypothetical protein
MNDALPQTVEDLIVEQIPEKLWHYTDFEGLRGIVKSKRIYATHIRYLNDREEFDHALATAKLELEGILKGLSGEDSFQIRLRNLVEGFLEQGPVTSNDVQVYTASFSVNGDQLSQWRGYSKGSSGVSLGFDLRWLRPPKGGDTLVSFAPCVYEDEHKRLLLRHALSSFAQEVMELSEIAGSKEAVDRTFNEIRTSQIEPVTLENVQHLLTEHFQAKLLNASLEMNGRLLRLGALLKHSAFVEEAEWRLVLPVTTRRPPTENPIQYCSRMNTLVPYIEFPISGMRDGVETLSLTNVVIGPGAEFDRAVPAVRSFLESQGLGQVEIRPSGIPYRPW